MVLTLSNLYYSQEYKYYEYINANNVLMWVGANGMGAHDISTGNGGLYWDTTAYNRAGTAIFADGPVFGFKLNGKVNVQASNYRYGFNPVPVGMNKYDSVKYIAKVRPDWKSLRPWEGRGEYQFYHEYYPWRNGAPYIDVNQNGAYNHEIDIPDYLGDEMLWWTSFADDSAKSAFVYGSPPVKLEIQTTVWAENTIFPDVVYKEYLFINHEPDSLTDFYFGYWSDPDVGNASDDYVGVDTSLNMMFAYNGDDNDEFWYGTSPASAGYLLLDGPVIKGVAGDTARNNGNILPTAKNLPLTSFQFYLGGSHIYSGPDMGVYNGSLRMYNQLKGLIWNGTSFVNPITQHKTKFCLSGDPISGEGWYEGEGWSGGAPPGDRRMVMSTGPFNMAPGDTNCVTIAICLARDTGRLNSLAKLKQLAADVKHHWLYEVERKLPEAKFIREEPAIPASFIISNNYPNPFNNVTNINMELPQSGNIKIVVFNALGEVVSEITEHSPTAGYKSIQINGSGLSSGVYFYTVLFRGETKLGKFVMLK